MADGTTETADSALLVIRGVRKDYESEGGVVHALREVDVTIRKGEFVAIVGTSGSGKSTLMNILGCLDRPTTGTYELAGIDVGGRSADARAIVRNRLIGFIFQGFNLLSRTTALENCELPLQYRGIPRGLRRERALSALELVGLSDRVHHTPNQLSGGQQQRVAIARALVTNPPLLLADEPTGNLDTKTSLEVLALLQKLNRERGITIVLVTHEADIAACASRVITMRDGRIVSDVTAPEPTDARRALSALPEERAHAAETESGVAIRARRRTLPWAVYAHMALGTTLGAGLGWLYGRLVLGQVFGWIVLASALAAESYFGVRRADRAIGEKPGTEERARMATYYTFGSALVVLPFLSWKWPHTWWSGLGDVLARGHLGAVSLLAAALMGLVLIRYVLLSLARLIA